jgi:hypothetical protein
MANEHPVKAELRELDADFEHETSGGKKVTVQFNPETLKVAFANQTVPPTSSGDTRAAPATQTAGERSTKLSVQLWFDITTPDAQVQDVRLLTEEVIFFVTPKPPAAGDRNRTPRPPAVRFLWGSFKFDGIIESLEESLEFFSNDGKPLRASISLSLSQGKLAPPDSSNQPGGAPGGSGGGPAATPSGAPPGTTPLAQAKAGVSLQGLSAGLGVGLNWQGIASANGIENPRMLKKGQLVDLNATMDVSAAIK